MSGIWGFRRCVINPHNHHMTKTVLLPHLFYRWGNQISVKLIRLRSNNQQVIKNKFKSCMVFHNADYHVYFCFPSTNEWLGFQLLVIPSLPLPKKLEPEFYCAHVQVPTGYIPKDVTAFSTFSFCGLCARYCRYIERQNTPRPTTRPERDSERVFT